MKKINLTCLLILAFLGIVSANISIQNLRVDYQTQPLGIDITNPHFSWEMRALDAQRGYAQKAYQIVVTDPNNQVVWDSKKVNSDI